MHTSYLLYSKTLINSLKTLLFLMHVKNDVKNEAKISNSSICEFNPYIAERMIQFFNIKKN